MELALQNFHEPDLASFRVPSMFRANFLGKVKILLKYISIF